jgi:hypothetical protein
MASAYDSRPLTCRSGHHQMFPTWKTRIRGKGDWRTWYERRCRWCGETAWALTPNAQ